MKLRDIEVVRVIFLWLSVEIGIGPIVSNILQMIVEVYYFHVLTLRVPYEFTDNAVRVSAGVKSNFLRLGGALAGECKKVDTLHSFSFVISDFFGALFALMDDVLRNLNTDDNSIERIIHLFDLFSQVVGQCADGLALVFLTTFNGRVIDSDDLA